MSAKKAFRISRYICCAVILGAGVIPQLVQAEELTTLSLSQARFLAQAAEKRAASNQTSVVVTVVDASGQPLLVERMAGAQLASIELSQRKAVSAVFYRRPSAAFEAALSGGKMAVLALPHAMPAGGGVPIFHNIQLVGGIGVSGGNNAQDSEAANAAVGALK
ncbi:heme-binding protein [Gluconobacter sp. Dm-62]|uniref:GlcG/HbpS family heme-binding protein n=1 Tax=Gluconobacter sp. Dm-62 TaxID=2799804 RepID=UPI001B8BDFE0|nr:heme-binding protein [Gluconobacter sp. Dm-62]MBS1102824.1 heme-binding protein [Gluconobacter sp. Dm-62]